MKSNLKPLVAGNWKMNGLRASLVELRAMIEGYAEFRGAVDLALCVPATLLHEASRIARESAVTIGAQDCHALPSGAHTGDISAEMVADAGGAWVIVGHSERRADHAESNREVCAKALAAQRGGIVPIVCIGETGDERRAGGTLAVLERQLAGSLPDEPGLVVAYEPVWAIGTGLTPTTGDVGKAHAFIREKLVERYGIEGTSMRVLYGGSVKPDNASELMSVENVNGALVGGASLRAADFLAIARACR
jgi:triosephosphate isomerase (TIM)